MSKKILGVVLVIAGAALMFIPGVGTALGLGMIAAGISTAAVIGLALTIAGNFLLGPSKPKGLSGADMGQDRLTATLVPTDPRKIVFGHTAMANDVRYQAFTGTNQEYLEMIVCHASHEVESIDELWLDNEQAESGGSILGRYAGYLTVQKRLVGTALNGIAIDGVWTSSATLTGCAYSHYKFKLTGNSSTAQSPFSGGVTSRMTIRGKGAKVYDPRLDSTVDGGSGTHRADDQTTWEWDDDASRNPALQELFYELGWKINSKLAVGKGLPSARIDLASYAVAANTCDESIALNGGGTEPRYRSDGVISEGDDPGAVRDNLCATMNAMLRDNGGQLSLTVIHDDLATPVAPYGKSAFDEDDILGELQWDQTPSLDATYNIVRGRNIDPSDTALYQPVDFPEITLVSNDGIDRIETVDYPFVQSNGQAQRLAKQWLQRNQYQGRITFTGKPSFWGLNIGDVFPLSHVTFGWTEKLFRCAGQKISRTGECEIVAVEENADIYAWDNDEAAPVTAGTPTVYDPLNDPLVRGIEDAVTRYIDNPPQRLNFKYTHLVQAEANEFPRDITFKLYDPNGQIASGLSWEGEVVTGGFSATYDSSSGPFGMGVSAMATLTVTSLEASVTTIKVTATYGGKPYVYTAKLTQEVPQAPVVIGTGGSVVAGGAISVKASGFTVFSSTSFTDITGTMTATTPAGVTDVDVNVQLDCAPARTTNGSWTVEMKLQRFIGGSWTDIGSTRSASSFWIAADFDGDDAHFLFSQNDSGLSASTSYDWRIVARLTSGTRLHYPTGSVTIST